MSWIGYVFEKEKKIEMKYKKMQKKQSPGLRNLLNLKKRRLEKKNFNNYKACCL